MKKLMILFGMFALFSLLFASAASAYSYYGNNYNNRDYIDGYSYTATRYRDTGYGPVQYKVNSYDRVTAEGFDRNGNRISTTAYVRTTTESPNYNYGGAYYGNPWYQNYYRYPDYNRNYYVYDYRPSSPYRFRY